MTPVAILALAKLAEKLAEKARAEVKAGKYLLDETVTVRLAGLLEIGEDTVYQPTTSIPWKKTLALFVRYSGVTREAALDALVRAMRESLKSGDEAADLLGALADLQSAEEQVQASLDKLPAQPRLGPVSTKKVSIEEVA